MIQEMLKLRADDDLEEIRDRLKRLVRRISRIIGSERSYHDYTMSCEIREAGSDLLRVLQERRKEIKEVKPWRRS